MTYLDEKETEITIIESLNIINSIQNQLKEMNQEMNTDVSFDLQNQIKVLDVYNTCKKELRKRKEENDFTKIASLCNALFIFPVISNKRRNQELIIRVLLDMTSKVDQEIYIENCDEILKNNIVKEIVKIYHNPRRNPYSLGMYLFKLYTKNISRKKQK